MRIFILFVCFALIATACNSDAPPSDLMDEDAYVNLLVELQLLKAFNKKTTADSTTVDSLQQLIFKKYETSEERFQRSHQYYQQSIKKQRDRIGQAIEDLRKDRLAGQDSAAVRDSVARADTTSPSDTLSPSL